MNNNKVSLFTWIRARQRGWSAGVVTLLLGGWLSAVCQQCLAYADHTGNTDNRHTTHIKEHCPPGIDQQQYVPAADHCSGVCDCATIVADTDDYRNLKGMISVISFDYYYALLDTTSGIYLIARVNFSPGLYRNPEHSTLLPSETFRVLLI